MNCALWLNKRKVFSAEEISENFDLAALRGYFLAGSLVPWLRENGGADLADRVSAIPENAPDLNDRISAIFGKTETPVSRFGDNAPICPSPACGVSGSSGGSYFAPTTLYFGSGGALGSFTFGTNFGSGFLGSFRIGSGYTEWEWEWFFKRSGSFSAGSYSITSYKGFAEWEWEWFFKRSGSFRVGSFNITSYKGFGSGFAEWERLFGRSFSSGGFQTAGLFSPELFGSFGGAYGSGIPMTSEEYDMIMYATLAKCPLNRFGYGIHNI